MYQEGIVRGRLNLGFITLHRVGFRKGIAMAEGVGLSLWHPVIWATLGPSASFDKMGTSIFNVGLGGFSTAWLHRHHRGMRLRMVQTSLLGKFPHVHCRLVPGPGTLHACTVGQFSELGSLLVAFLLIRVPYYIGDPKRALNPKP